MKKNMTVSLSQETTQKIRTIVYNNPQLTISSLIEKSVLFYMQNNELDDQTTKEITLKRGKRISYDNA